jgi:tripartite motif-containing protein 2/3
LNLTNYVYAEILIHISFSSQKIGITNYPIGVGINAAGEVIIADNHNNFNLSVFSQDGQLLAALESKVKHAQCFDVSLMDDGSVVLASKDYRLYIYRYVQVPPIGM